MDEELKPGQVIAAAIGAANAWPFRAPMPTGGSGKCIEATRYLIEALRPLGIKARPLPCAIVVANNAAIDPILQGLPADQWPADAWSIGVDPNQPHPGSQWNGHLIAEHELFICDLSLGEMSRPAKNLHLEPTVIPRALLTQTDQGFIARNESTLLMVFPRPELAAWRKGSAWRQEPDPALVKTMTAAARDYAGIA